LEVLLWLLAMKMIVRTLGIETRLRKMWVVLCSINIVCWSLTAAAVLIGIPTLLAATAFLAGHVVAVARLLSLSAGDNGISAGETSIILILLIGVCVSVLKEIIDVALSLA
jgi:hypothetical protein